MSGAIYTLIEADVVGSCLLLLKYVGFFVVVFFRCLFDVFGFCCFWVLLFLVVVLLVVIFSCCCFVLIGCCCRRFGFGCFWL